MFEQKIETKDAEDSYSPAIDLSIVNQSAKNLMNSFTMISRRKQSLCQDVVLKETVSSTPADHINQSVVDLEITNQEIEHVNLPPQDDNLKLS